jgi:hypothetical protein
LNDEKLDLIRKFVENGGGTRLEFGQALHRPASPPRLRFGAS